MPPAGTGPTAGTAVKGEVTDLTEHAARYAGERHWDVFPGTWLEIDKGVPRCSCGAAGCDAPGAHPVRPGWAAEATGSATAARRMWAERPQASVLLPTGRTFDAVEVSETAGCLALARMERQGLRPGPVIGAPGGRMTFLVLPGAAARIPDLVRRLGLPPAAIGLTALGEGSWVAAPPTRLGTRGPVLWVREPTDANRWLPDAEEIVPALAYACGRDLAAATGR
ncbi:bifunctional DNA primase/polymerase [Streptomyces sp. TRM 70361]|uniref:bifunctional DNA primase/polymerase n=1 Tax=Streptomyces sp. TRM 70361 TaxID=3116553 RepID=UPI002E7BE0B9|nr:bifunctional DNA primase/polymerase [Streptomyces sp. TRM 70361]MEE1938356.1 bifunctional DNA primase/polymerase [Streptomyces sp. TRM 70361]